MATPIYWQPVTKTTKGFFHSEGTWGCAAGKCILFRGSSEAKGMHFGNLILGKARLGDAIGQFVQRNVKFW